MGNPIFGKAMGHGSMFAILKILIFFALLLYWYVTVTVYSLFSKYMKCAVRWIFPMFGLVAAANFMGSFIAMFLELKPFGGANVIAYMWASGHIKFFGISMADLIVGAGALGLLIAVGAFIYGAFIDRGNFHLRRAKYIPISYLLWVVSSVAVVYLFKTDVVSFLAKVKPFPLFEFPRNPAVSDPTILTASENRALLIIGLTSMLGFFNFMSSGMALYALMNVSWKQRLNLPSLKIGGVDIGSKLRLPRSMNPNERSFQTIGGPISMTGYRSLKNLVPDLAFEYAVADLMRRRYGDAITTDELVKAGKISFAAGTGDQGCDVIVYYNENGEQKAMLVQCKLYSSPVDNKAVQEVRNAQAVYANKFGIKAEALMVITNSSFKPSALEAAADDVILVDGRDLQRMVLETEKKAA